ncbi:MAG TPA: ADOP family duplicated permease, partial [Acidobacteriaceae bacterium]|nr:ADOP family duplicated permease [Acidobacteriaceae bacterium]
MFTATQDFHFALRQLRKSPGYAAVAIVTLALGIGANTAIFLLTYSILLRSLPVPHPSELIRYTFRKGESDIGLSYPQYQALQKRQGIATGLFAWQSGEATLTRNGHSQKIPVGLTTGSAFPILQLHPALGRGFAPNVGEKGNGWQPEALLSYDYWRSAFHADSAIVGQSIRLENTSITIIGVLPRGFDGIFPERPIDVLLPLDFEGILHPKNSMLYQPGAFWLTVMGRLRSGETMQAAQANLAAIQAPVTEAADPSHNFLTTGFFADFRLGVESGRGGRSFLRWRYAKPLLALEALCGLMMLLCGVNVALVVVSRVSSRLHEFAMRSALGASRRRLLLQVLTETLLLGAGGLAGGALLGWEMARGLVSMISGPAGPDAVQLQAGAVVFLFAAVVSLGAALIAGLWPAWRASHTAPALDLKQTASARTAHRLGRWIIPSQVALGVVLLNAALLLAGTLSSYLRENSGFNADQTSLTEIDVANLGVPIPNSAARAMDLLREVEGAPGIRSAALMSLAPINGGFSVGGYYTLDPKGNRISNQQVWPETASTSYFDVMGTRILEGRGFQASDASGESICVISAAAATFFFPGRSALGGLLNSGDGSEKPVDRATCRVVGIAEDARMRSLLEPPPLAVYLPLRDAKDFSLTYATLGVRAANPALATAAIRQAFTRVFPGAPAPRIWRFQDAERYDLSRQRLLSSVSGGFALLALALVATGLYGILSRAVTERRREIGIRMALGARRQQIVSTLARGTALRILVGVIAGIGLAAAAGRLLQSLLYGVTPGSPLVALATFAVLMAVLVLAFVFPAGRAASVDPMEA